ncbi:hypothetical protein CATMIT_01775, partial [Catenibacterium mitsuokai DSM 15897]
MLVVVIARGLDVDRAEAVAGGRHRLFERADLVLGERRRQQRRGAP